MLTVILLLLAALGLIVGLFVVGTVFSVAFQLFLGLIIGGLARWFLPGEHKMGWLATALCGIVGSLLGGMLAHHVFHTRGLTETALNIACAMGMVWLLGRM